jgi:methylated-DNA-[protein]-cysteine S-methyltransferase
MNVYTQRYQSPAGEMIVAVDDSDAVIQLVLPNGHHHWANYVMDMGYKTIPDSPRCDNAIDQLDEYFQQKRTTFDLPLKPQGTSFQKTVWSALQTIPYGTTISYKELAERINNPESIRAVGRANATNCIPIIIPCHRVIGADGSLTGFGGGLPLKEFLLKLEGVQLRTFSRRPVQQLALL